ncbi:MAG: Hint domain-containing protein, partial [Proteobacteria bacterium]|nr:Hint domain-containing protein [Pseudomonadota bacterium]
AGTFRPLANNELINPGTQTFRVIADGVVLDARIMLNGATFLERIAGFDSQGTPKSQAFNPAGTAQVVGSFTADFVGMLNPMGVADWGKLDQYSDGGNSCTILNFPPPGGSPSPSTANVSVDLRGVDDGFDAASTKTFPLKISAGDNGFANSSNYNDDANPNNFVAACPNTCDHYGVTDFSEKLNGKDWWVWEEEARVKQLRSGQFRDIYNPNGKKFNGLHYIAGPYYICTDYTKMGPHILSYYGAQNLSELSDQQIGSAMGNSAPIAESSEWVAYDIRDCKPRFVVARSDCGCFRESTKIQLADGSQKPIEQLSEHDLIYNPMNQKSYAIRQMIQGPENKPLYLIKIGQRQIEVTEEHPFPSKRGLLPAASLKAGDQVADGQDGYETIESIELRQYEKSPIVWNIELEAGADAIEHYVLADGVVTGDLFLQKSLKNKNVKP